VLGQILIQFVFRLTFGMALAMACTPARLVTSGYYRVHLWVLMGINTLAALAVYSGDTHDTLLNAKWRLVLAITLAVLSYIGAVVWLYERSRGGKWFLVMIAVVGYAAAISSISAARMIRPGEMTLWTADLTTSGLLMGATMAAMLLGHWYLNTPSMHLLPLARLVGLMTTAVVLRGIASGIGLAFFLQSGDSVGHLFISFLLFRWLAGIIGVFVLAQMARLTLKIPNTQSATGILYAAVILVFLGELTAQLLSVDAKFPV